MKKIAAAFVTLVILCLCGCGQGNPPSQETAPSLANQSEYANLVPSSESDNTEEFFSHSWYNNNLIFYGIIASGERNYLEIQRTAEGNIFSLMFRTSEDLKTDDTYSVVSGTWEYGDDGTYLLTSSSNETLQFSAEVVDNGSLMLGWDNMGINASAEFVPTEKDSDWILFPELALEDATKYEVEATAIHCAYINDDCALHLSGVIKNTGSVPISLTNISFDVEDESGEFLESVSASEIIPSIILPGERGFVSEIEFLHDQKAELLTSVDLQTALHFTCKALESAEVLRLDVEDAALTDVPGDYWGVKGRIINNRNEKAISPVVGCAIYDDNDSLLGVINAIRLADIEANDKLGFEGDDWPIPKSFIKLDDVARIDAAAFCVYK